MYEISKIAILTVFRIGFFGAAKDEGAAGESDSTRFLLQKICHTHPTVMKLDTPLGFC